MYLIIGDDRDPCVGRVRSALERRGRRVVSTPNPFGPPGRVSWNFDTLSSRLEHAFGEAPVGPGGTLDGVFLRCFVALGDAAGWALEDAAYLHSEATAAVLAWLHALRCPVVGRPSDDSWYRPQRALPEWVGIFASSGLRTPKVVVTNASDPASLEAGWSGRAMYQPLTSPRRYAIQGPAWPELAKVAQHVPVCLCDPLEGPVGAVTIVGERLFWTIPPAFDRDQCEDGARRVGARLESDFLQLTYHLERDGPTFTTASLQPALEVHDPVDQDAIVEELVTERLLAPVVHDVHDETRGARSVAEVG